MKKIRPNITFRETVKTIPSNIIIYSSEKVIIGRIYNIYTKLVPVIIYTGNTEIKSFILLKEATKHKISNNLAYIEVEDCLQRI